MQYTIILGKFNVPSETHVCHTLISLELLMLHNHTTSFGFSVQNISCLCLDDAHTNKRYFEVCEREVGYKRLLLFGTYLFSLLHISKTLGINFGIIGCRLEVEAITHLFIRG